MADAVGNDGPVRPEGQGQAARHWARIQALDAIQRARSQPAGTAEWVDRILAGDRNALAQGITLVESRREADRRGAEALLDAVLTRDTAREAAQRSVRIGITGIPGVGKSTLIERLGLALLDRGHRVAVLAIDPSSPQSGGSLLGDKTRMEGLMQQEGAFIRPSPAADALGGVARATHEALLLCEAAGYDRILVETVGVGQSETAVRHLTDIFLLLTLPGTGDELQGIKRGIMEMADVIFVNKADGDRARVAEEAAQSLRNVLHWMLPQAHGATVEVMTGSGLSGSGLDGLCAQLEALEQHLRGNGYWVAARQRALLHLFDQHVRTLLLDTLLAGAPRRAVWEQLQNDILQGQICAFSAARIFVQGVDSSR